MFKLSNTALDATALRDELQSPNCGALNIFEGRVRNHNDGLKVLRLEYEAYDELAVLEGNKIIEEAKTRFDIEDVLCVHRVGMLEITDVAVWVGTISAHRDAAFQACRFVIDEIKHRVPIWKREHYENAKPQWVNCHHHAESEPAASN